MKYLAIFTDIRESSSKYQVHPLVAVIARVEAEPVEKVIVGVKECTGVCAGLLGVVVADIKADFLVLLNEPFILSEQNFSLWLFLLAVH